MVGAKIDLKASGALDGPLAKAFAEALGQSVDALPAEAAAFVVQAQDDWSADELPGVDAADTAHALADFW
ncbi:hypothetical protein, partial [Caulobacter sp. HMWF009]